MGTCLATYILKTYLHKNLKNDIGHNSTHTFNEEFVYFKNVRVSPTGQNATIWKFRISYSFQRLSLICTHVTLVKQKFLISFEHVFYLRNRKSQITSMR